jgi:hypothetical protein
MFKLFTRAAWLGCCIGVVMSGADALAAATVSLKAVKINGVAIAGGPTNTIDVVPGDTITAELRFSGWGNPKFDALGGGTGLVRTYQAQVAGRMGVQSSGPGGGLVLPIGWDAPLIKDQPPCDDPLYPVPNVQYGCVGPTFNANLMGSIDNLRADFLLFGFGSQIAVANDSLDNKWGGTIIDSDGQSDAGGAYYGGTFNLRAMPARAADGRPAMCGRFTFDLVNDITATFICNPLTPPYCALPVLQSLVINGPPCPGIRGACCNTTTGTGVCTDDVLDTDCRDAGERFGGPGSTCATLDPPCIIPPNRIVSSNPLQCAIDARIPFLQGQPTQRRGFQSIALTFERTAGATEDGAGDYTVQTFGTGPGSPTISNVVLNGTVATVTFVAPIPTRKWSCVLHNASNTRRCIGGLPADANGDRTAAPVDILDIIDNLNGVTNPPLAIYQCDIDRSALCAPADILMEIDLLNGASGYPPANGTTLPACPSTTGP